MAERGPPDLHHPRAPARPTCRPPSHDLRDARGGRPHRVRAAGRRRPRPPMKYVSTRGRRPSSTSATSCSPAWPTTAGSTCPSAGRRSPSEVVGRRCRPYAEVAVDVMWPFVEGAIDRDDVRARIVADAYAHLRPPRRVPAVALGDGLAPARAVPRAHPRVQGRRPPAGRPPVRPRAARTGASGPRSSCATSGDTGSAAIEACVGPARASTSSCCTPPAGCRDVQRRQMTTVDAPNVHNVAVDGTFDDCQDLVKALLRRRASSATVRLSAVNSINWARVMAQIVYYVTDRGRRLTARCVVQRAHRELRQRARLGTPPGGWACRSTGSSWPPTATTSSPARSPTGTMATSEVVPTLSPAMDIQVSSNLERLLFELSGATAPRTAELLGRFRARRASTPRPRPLTRRVPGRAASTTRRPLAGSGEVHAPHGILVDPHTAVGIGGRLRPVRTRRVADGLPGHRPPGQVPRRGRGRHRHPPAAARPPGRPVRPRRALRALPADVGRPRPRLAAIGR